MSERVPERHDQKFELTDVFLRAVVRWENAPHNQPGQDKTWVEQLISDARDHHRRAVRVR